MDGGRGDRRCRRCFVAVLLVFGVFGVPGEEAAPRCPSCSCCRRSGVVLSFAARRVIRNAEGTRTGENLANTAWWICADRRPRLHRLPVRDRLRDPPRRARTTLDRWIEKVKAGDDVSINDAFLRTRDPAQRGQDLARRHRAALRPVPRRLHRLHADRPRPDRPAQQGGMRVHARGREEWAYKPGRIDCVFNGHAEVPGGDVPDRSIGLKGSRGGGRRAAGGSGGSGVSRRIAGLRPARQLTLTPYGWLVAVEESGAGLRPSSSAQCPGRARSDPLRYQAMMKPDSNVAIRGPGRWPRRHFRAVAVTGVLAAAGPVHERLRRVLVPDHFFKAAGGGEPTADKRRPVQIDLGDDGPHAGEAGGSRNSLDKQAHLSRLPTQLIEVRVPVRTPASRAGERRGRPRAAGRRVHRPGTRPRS